jgi:mannose-1-phosphate guanylyltransferase/mannose-6-phosphate isomerase
MADLQKHLYVLILAGGGGTRLWPQSREEYPKQFAKLFGGESLFEITLKRAYEAVSPDHVIISTAAKYLKLVRSLAAKIPAENFIGEPMRRDTALAMGVACTLALKKDPDAVVVNMASDHLISPLRVFISQVKKAAQVALDENEFVTIGIKPKFPHPGLGHIRARKKHPKLEGVLIGEKFVEKPPLPLAEKYTKSGEYYWNTNLFVFKAKLFLDLLSKHSPKVYALLPKLFADWGTTRERETLQMTFQMSPSIAVDYAVAEHLRKFICIPAEFNWTDVGDWKEVYNNLPKDELGNVIEGPHGRGKYIGINSKNNLLFLDKKIIATVGLEDMLIIDTPDALLICPKDEAQGVKQVVQALKESDLTEYL